VEIARNRYMIRASGGKYVDGSWKKAARVREGKGEPITDDLERLQRAKWVYIPSVVSIVRPGSKAPENYGKESTPPLELCGLRGSHAGSKY